jgi:hypothetical protein
MTFSACTGSLPCARGQELPERASTSCVVRTPRASGVSSSRLRLHRHRLPVLRMQRRAAHTASCSPCHHRRKSRRVAPRLPIAPRTLRTRTMPVPSRSAAMTVAGQEPSGEGSWHDGVVAGIDVRPHSIPRSIAWTEFSAPTRSRYGGAGTSRGTPRVWHPHSWFSRAID